jgi:diguanylate cyclase
VASDGRLVVVGCGIEFGRHIGERCLAEIRIADTVFALVDPFALQWLQGLHSDIRDLCRYYADDKDRRLSYRDMESAILTAVRAGRRVCAVFYGHPGIFAQVPHDVVRIARSEGYMARMEPGISAEACLYADLGLNPGRRGMQSWEATQFLINQRVLDPSALVLLWQVALTGNLDCVGFQPEPKRLRLLVDKLSRWYQPDHEVILYEAARLPIEDFRADRIGLADLPDANLNEYTTLVIPPAVEMQADEAVLTQLRELG